MSMGRHAQLRQSDHAAGGVAGLGYRAFSTGRNIFRGAVLFWAVVTASHVQTIAAEGWDRIDEALSVSSPGGDLRAHLSGDLDLETYRFGQPAPAFIDAPGRDLFVPRLVLFLDAQAGSAIYAFAQARVDRGFDPSTDSLQARLDEYAVRVTPWRDGRLSLQGGKFATIVGNWVLRHGAWDNPFITAPLPYENLTGLWDAVAVRTAETLLDWAHVRPRLSYDEPATDKYLRLPIIWGPSYGRGFSMAGELGAFTYAGEVKNTSLSARPAEWSDSPLSADRATLSGRVGFRPNPMWNFGFSASDGPYLKAAAEASIPSRYRIGDYRERVLAQDASFAWHHLQLWAECFEARFAIPGVGEAGTVSYYVEARYKFATAFSAAVRWNEQSYSSFSDGAGERVPWGDRLWRIDVAPCYRISPQAQVKFQYSLQHGGAVTRTFEHTFALQVVLKL
jgi:hypothetical protein